MASKDFEKLLRSPEPDVKKANGDVKWEVPGNIVGLQRQDESLKSA